MLEVGQELWFVHRERRSGAPFTTKVTKIGRKWAQLDSHYRIDVATMVADGGQYTSPGRCWVSREEWEVEVARNDAWWKLRRMIERQSDPPAGLSTEQIGQIIGTLMLP